MIKVSVIIPVYNVAAYIVKCLESVQMQTLSDFECLIVNDGTKDNSIELARDFLGEDERFIFLDKENGGLSSARNFGLERAKGEYVFFLDSDDFIAPNLLADAYERAKKSDSDIVCFDLYYCYDDGRLEISKGGDFDCTSYPAYKELLFINNSANNKLYRTSFMQDKRFIKGLWYEDLASVVVWLAQANRVAYLNEPLYYYVQRNGSISHNCDPRVFDIYKAIANIKKELSLSSEEVARLYYNNCLVMTTLRIKEFGDKEKRLAYYAENIRLLNEAFPAWYRLCAKWGSLKQRIIFFLLKNKMFKLVDRAYR